MRAVQGQEAGYVRFMLGLIGNGVEFRRLCLSLCQACLGFVV